MNRGSYKVFAVIFWLLALCVSAAAQGCGEQNPNCIVPTRPLGDSTNAAASTEFVQKNSGGGNAITSLTGDVTATGPGAAAATIVAGAVTGAKIASGTITGSNIASNTVANSNLANMAAGTLKGSIGGGSPSDLTGAQAESLLLFTQSGAGATQRTVNSILQEKWPSLEDFGAVCDGTTNDATALTNAAAAFSVVYLGPPASSTGTKCKVSTLSTALTGRLFGENAQIVDGSGNQRAYFFSAISANQPYTATNENSIDTAFNGNFTGSQFVIEHRISGALTLTQPTTGYVYSPWAYPIYGVMDVASNAGFNNSTSSNAGRTAAVVSRVNVKHHGNGDGVAYNCSGFVDGSKSGATNFLASPAVICMNGDMSAGAAGTYLNPLEWSLSDSGFDVAAIGEVVNLNRTVNTGALGVTWGGYTGQSNGSKAADWFMRATGPWNTGIDFTQANFGTNQTAAALLAGQRIYLNATSSGTYTNTPGGTWIDFNSGNSCVETVVGGKRTICLDTNGHVRVPGSAPAPTSCGTGTPTVVGSDIAGLITMGTSATGCTVTFNVAYNNPPFCTVTWQTNLAAMSYTVSASTIVITQTSTSGNKINYNCKAQGGG